MRGRGLIVEQRAIGDSDDAGVGIDREAAPSGIVEAVGDRVGAVGVGGEGRHTNGGAIGGILGNGIGVAVAVGDRADVEFVDVGQRNREALRRADASRVRHLDGQTVAAAGLVV